MKDIVCNYQKRDDLYQRDGQTRNSKFTLNAMHGQKRKQKQPGTYVLYRITNSFLGDSDMVIIAEFRINNGTDLARSGCNLDSFAKKKNSNNIFLQIICQFHGKPPRKHRTLLRF